MRKRVSRTKRPLRKMARYGFMGIPVPREYGGQGCDPLTYAMCVEELAKVCGTTAVIVSAHTSLCMDPIMTFGTEEQKQKYLPDLAKGEKLGRFRTDRARAPEPTRRDSRQRLFSTETSGF
jgi:butyryl-CoA dehydrogenase